MASHRNNTANLLDLVRAALRDALARSHPAKAWELLQDRDAEGNPLGSRPYTDEALAEFAVAHELNPDDIEVVHHLAIAHHARAWDFELAGDTRAPQEWEDALGFWRAVATSKDFWISMEAKLRACDPSADPEPIRAMQRDMLEHLLDIHVAFIRHYCETGVPQRANAHVNIIRRAKIPPVVKKRLVDKVFDAMTASVTEAKASSAYESALISVERFLEVFPEHRPALRLHAEVGKAWLSTMSWQRDWDAILLLHQRVSPPAARLSADPELTADSLARTALEELAFEFMLRGTDRGVPYFRDSEVHMPGVIRHDDAVETFELVIYWGRLAGPHATDSSQLRDVLAQALFGHAQLLGEEASDAYANRTDPVRGLTTAIELNRKMVANLEEASRLDCNNAELFDVIQNALATVRQGLTDLEREQSIVNLTWGA